MSSAGKLRAAKIFVLILAVADIILAVGITIKEHLSKKNDYKFIHNETEWNALYISLVVCAILMLYGIFRNEHLVIIASIVVKVLSALILIYALIRGKLEIFRCEKELCRYSESSHCPACYGSGVKNNFDYEYTRPWTGKFSEQKITILEFLTIIFLDD